MSDEAGIIASLLRAVDVSPTDVPLRLLLVNHLLDAGRNDEAISQLSVLLGQEPNNVPALLAMRRALATSPALPSDDDDHGHDHGHGHGHGHDWDRAAQDLADAVPPGYAADRVLPEQDLVSDAVPGTVRLADVGGMEQVKRRLDAAFLAPMRNPELSRAFRKSLRGGLLLYGPPGCGKTFIARAIAGELGARFHAVTLADVLDMFIGNSERHLRDVFVAARRNAPCVLFFDEIDALGRKRSQLANSAARGVVNQFLTELDGVDTADEGVFVLAATNAPWDVDVALRRPGRLDRTLLVLPPDRPAREAILRHHLKGRPVSGLRLDELAKRTDGYSGADLAHVCDSAAELALMYSAASGTVHPITMTEIESVLAQVRPSISAWLEAARNVVLYANGSGAYDELADYLKARRLL
ncbi:MAG TPA: ATP-binding protein [Actinospica sp.]|jgi:SpoVK/Ycf46/Vps4 family AAA+-type ATPase|nr:ATP-binding protein [Actinospica sp.]